MQQTQPEEIREGIRAYLVEAFLDQMATPADDDDLLKVLNSLELLRMVLDLEGRFAIKIDNSELTAENLGTIRRIAAFVSKKIARGGAEQAS